MSGPKEKLSPAAGGTKVSMILQSQKLKKRRAFVASADPRAFAPFAGLKVFFVVLGLSC